MNPASPPPRQPSRPQSGITVRSVLVGCLMCIVIGLVGPYWSVFLMSSRMFADYHTAGATFFLFILLVVFNLGLGRLWRPLAFRAGELMAVTAMMLVGGSIVSSGLIAYFIPGMTAPYAQATSSNRWNEIIWPHMKPWLAPLDPNGGTFAIRKFWQGLEPGAPILWGPWLRPIALWGIFLLALFVCMIAVMALMRKQWIDNEHLSYPIAQVPAELCAAGARSSGAGSILRSGAFWIGVGVMFLLASSGGVGHYFGGLSAFRISHDVTGLGPAALPINLQPVVVGLVFLIPNRVAFSVWFLTLVSWGVRGFMTAYNLNLSEYMVYGVVGNPSLQHLAMGGLLVFFFASIWLSRGHLRRAWRCALGRGERGYDAAEPARYRTIFAVVLLSILIMLVWLHAAGLSLWFAALFLLMILVVYYGMARVIAQCGLPSLNSPALASTWLASIFGGAAIGSQQATLLGATVAWHADLRNSVMSGAGHGMYLAEKRTRGLFWPMVLALVVTYVTGCLFSVYLGYRHGAANMDTWFYQASVPHPWNWTASLIQGNRGPSGAGMVWTAAGAVLMASLILAQRSLFWWPIHPVGFLICSSFLVTAFWFSIFLAWLIKVFIVEFGGYGLYRGARRFFIGSVLGYFLAGGLWAFVDTFTGSVGNQVFYL